MSNKVNVMGKKRHHCLNLKFKLGLLAAVLGQFGVTPLSELQVGPALGTYLTYTSS